MAKTIKSKANVNNTGKHKRPADPAGLFKGGNGRKDQDERRGEVVRIKGENPNLSNYEIGKIVGVHRGTVGRILKAYEEEYDVLEKNIEMFTDNKDLILAGTSAKIIKRMNETLPEAKFRELAYALRQIEDIRARDKGVPTGDLGTLMQMIDTMATGALKKQPVIEAEIVVEEEEK